jgi:NADPH:quinone reductase
MSNLVKAIRIEQNGGPEVLKLVEIEVPAPADNEITIRQHAAGLNFIDIYFRDGLYKNPLPHGLGFEGAGDVIAVGKAVKQFKVGDRVAYGQSPLGGYAQARNVPAAQVVKLPKGHYVRASRSNHAQRLDGSVLCFVRPIACKVAKPFCSTQLRVALA